MWRKQARGRIVDYLKCAGLFQYRCAGRFIFRTTHTSSRCQLTSKLRATFGAFVIDSQCDDILLSNLRRDS
jgi:hypothetical protein